MCDAVNQLITKREFDALSNAHLATSSHAPQFRGISESEIKTHKNLIIQGESCDIVI